MDLLITLLCGVSMTLIIGKSLIFAPLRNCIKLRTRSENWLWKQLDTLIHCQQCLGFWCGLFVGFVGYFDWTCIACALLTSLLAVWNDFGLLALSRHGQFPHPMHHETKEVKHIVHASQDFDKLQHRAEEMVGLRQKENTDEHH